MPHQRTDIPTVAATGSLDLETSRELASELGQLAGQPGDAILDLTEVSFIDSVGIGVVVKAVGRFQRQGKRLVLVAPPDSPARRLLAFAGVEGRAEIVDRDEAAADLLMD